MSKDNGGVPQLIPPSHANILVTLLVLRVCLGRGHWTARLPPKSIKRKAMQEEEKLDLNSYVPARLASEV